MRTFYDKLQAMTNRESENKTKALVAKKSPNEITLILTVPLNIPMYVNGW